VLRIAGNLGCNEAFDSIYAATSDPDLRTAEIAVGALAALEDPRADGAIATLAQSPEPTLRAAAQRAAATRPSPAMLAIIQHGIRDSAPWVRYYACRALGQLGYATTIPLLVDRLSDVVPHIRIAAIEALSRFDTDLAWQALSAAAHASDADERRAALLGISRHRRPEVTQILLAAADDPDTATELIALSGLAINPDPRALTRLAVAAGSTDLSIRDAALSLLADRTDVGAANVLLDLAITAPLEHPVHLALSRPHAMRIATIAKRLGAANENEAAVFVPALARMGDPAAMTALFETLLAASPPARRTAAIALVAIAANGARGAVARMAVEDPDPDVRRACAAAVS
jgi:HEAT repeat protein